MGEVASLHMYPLKGAQPMTVDHREPTSFEVHHAGLMLEGIGDREFFLAAQHGDGLVAVTPRGWDAEGPKIAHDRDRLLSVVETNISTLTRDLEFTYAGDTMEINLADLQQPAEFDRRIRPVRLHGGVVLGVDTNNDEAADFFSTIVDRDVRLMRTPKRTQRILAGGIPTDARAADGYPYLITVKGSLDALNRRARTSTQMSQYRPNIVVDLGEVTIGRDGMLPEDTAGVFEIGNHLFDVASASGRCIVTNLINGERVGVGLPTIRSRYGVKLDRDGKPREGTEGKFFGDNANLFTHLGSGIMLSVGDQASIWRPSAYPHVRLKEGRA